MKITVRAQGAASVRADVLALAAFKTSKSALGGAAGELDKALKGALKKAWKAEGFNGSRDTSFTTATMGGVPASRLSFHGVGAASGFDVGTARMLGARAARAARRARAGKLAIVVPSHKTHDAADLATWITQGVLMGDYRFRRYTTGNRATPSPVKELILVATDAAERRRVKAGADRGAIEAAAVNAARDLINEPASELFPAEFAKRARAMARAAKLTCKVLEPAAMARQKMRLHLAVGQGSDNPPRLVHLTYKPTGRGKLPTYALVGKGITFDSGGLSLKPPKSMVGMHYDMSGAAAVFGAMQAVAALKPRAVVHGIIGLAENMPSARAYRPNDIITGRAGKSVEIISTDAEGRLVLADALSYASDLKPDWMIDLATLTGACLVALGQFTAGCMSNDADLRQQVVDAGGRAGEDIWPLPLTRRLRESLKTEHADLKNTGDSYGGAITAGLFLKEFVGDTTWAHLDIAGPASADKENALFRRGGTGFGVLTLVDLIANG